MHELATDDAIDVRATYAGKHVLLTGCTGFLGKVWLRMALEHLSDIRRLYVVVRSNRTATARQRFEDLLGTSPLFASLHQEHGHEFASMVGDKVELIDGDLNEPQLGMPEPTRRMLRRNLDLIIHCAGDTDFNPDVRVALRSNVDGALQMVDLARSCDDAAMVHVSTCYVAGRGQRQAREEFRHHVAPNGEPFDAGTEYTAIQQIIDDVVHEAEGLGKTDALKAPMVAIGRRRAESWGWHNTYTYTKAIAEALVIERAGDLPLTIFRPAIIESALEYPFPGWNDGFNASGPLVYVLSKWCRLFPSRTPIAFDVIPVDLVVKALVVAGAAVMLNRHAKVYQCGTSVRNLLTVGRATELTGLGHRKYFREHGTDFIEREILSRWDAVCVDPNHPLRMENLKKGAGLIRGLLKRVSEAAPEPVASQAKRWSREAGRAQRAFSQINLVWKSFEPFVCEPQHRYVSDAISRHRVEPQFTFDPESIDWRRYWIDIHMPGLRRWVFPKIEGGAPERYEPETPFVLPPERKRVRQRAVASDGGVAARSRQVDA